MSDTPQTENSEADSGQGAIEQGINWADPNVPAGDSPPLPQWPLAASIAAFCLWIVFLVAMAVMRINTTPY